VNVLPSGTSSSLLDRVRADEAGAWDRLVALYAPLLYHWCRRWKLREEDLADVFQEVFKALVQKLPDFRREREGDSFRGWLFTITRNKARDVFRRREHEALEDLPAPEVAEDDTEALKALFHRGLELIRGEFEQKTWKAFWGTAIDGRGASEVGAELSMTPGAVRVAKSRVLARLREELGER
jgi:RNA polymerase sigma-70 factor (ECF subfamily)